MVTHARILHALCIASETEARVRHATMTRAFETSEKTLHELRQELITQEMLEVTGARRAGLAAPRGAIA